MECESEASSTDKCQPFEIKAEDITEHDDKPRPYLCTVCDKRFTRKDNLNKHKQIHSGKYKCTECGKCFGDSEKLAIHRRSHSGEKPFECSVCRKRFTTAGSLVVHSRIHSGEKPYKCHMCDKAFSVSGNLNSHMRVHMGDKGFVHGEKPTIYTGWRSRETPQYSQWRETICM